MFRYEYQVGGSLRSNAPSYIRRQADTELLEALLRGEFCYVFNAHQMGKSSLRVQTRHRLQQAGMRCASLDLSIIGSQSITPEQWYKSIMIELLGQFDLHHKINFKSWWYRQQDCSLLQKLKYFFEEILLTEFAQEPLLILVDEIDSIYNLDFSANDFLTFIRYCYDQRTEQSIYDRLNWAVFGVAMPHSLSSHPHAPSAQTHTLFQIGRAIELKGFSETEAQPLAIGLAGHFKNPQFVLHEILSWTNGQPFLTQKLCQLAAQNSFEWAVAEAGLTPGLSPDLAEWVGRLVVRSLISSWESQDQPEHLRTIHSRLLRNPEQSIQLLSCYQRILAHSIDEQTSQSVLHTALDTALDTNMQTGSASASSSPGETKQPGTPSDRSLLQQEQLRSKRLRLEAQQLRLQTQFLRLKSQRYSYSEQAIEEDPALMDLMLTGLVEWQEDSLRVKNRIYQSVFNLRWVEQQLSRLRPYAKQLDAWVISGYQNDDCLLRGAALQDIILWAQGKSLSRLDQRFLAASQSIDRQERRQSLIDEQLQDIARLAAERQRYKKQNRRLLVVTGASLAGAATVGFAALLCIYAGCFHGAAIPDAHGQVFKPQPGFTGADPSPG